MNNGNGIENGVISSDNDQKARRLLAAIQVLARKAEKKPDDATIFDEMRNFHAQVEKLIKKDERDDDSGYIILKDPLTPNEQQANRVLTSMQFLTEYMQMTDKNTADEIFKHMIDLQGDVQRLIQEDERQLSV